MTSDFIITPTPPTSIKLKPGQQGSFSFTITSHVAPDVIRDVVLVALLGDGKGKKEVPWVTVEPRQISRMPGGKTETVAITVRPTTASPRGEHTIQLTIADKDQPNDVYGESATVACEVLPPDGGPTPTKFPLWVILAIVGGLVAIGGGALLIWKLASGGNAPVADGPVADGPVADGPAVDGRTCAGNTVQACGPDCVTCQVSGDRAVPTCDGRTCGFECKNNAPRCSDSTCSRMQWTFESGSVDGITPRAPSGLTFAVRNFNGAQAMAIDVTTLQEISFRIPVCLSGVIDVRSRTFSLRVFYQDGPGQQSGDLEQYFLQASVPSPQTSAYLGQRGVAANKWVSFSVPLNASQFSDTCSEVTVQTGTYGGAFRGTIWFDDIKIE